MNRPITDAKSVIAKGLTRAVKDGFRRRASVGRSTDLEVLAAVPLLEPPSLGPLTSSFRRGELSSMAAVVASPLNASPPASPAARWGSSTRSGERLRRPLLICGIAASGLWVATDLLAGLLADDYSFVGRSISELSAVDAPTRPLVLPLNLVYDALMVAFGVGVWEAAGGRRLARVTAALIITHAVVSGVFVLVPMRVSESFGTTANTINVIVGATSVFLFLFAIGFGAAAFRGWFRYGSIAILAAYALLTVYGVVNGPQAAWGEHGSRVGLQERSMVYGYLLWVAALAILLLREQARVGAAQRSRGPAAVIQ